jgi:hypothetical protein
MSRFDLESQSIVVTSLRLTLIACFDVSLVGILVSTILLIVVEYYAENSSNVADGRQWQTPPAFADSRNHPWFVEAAD